MRAPGRGDHGRRPAARGHAGRRPARRRRPIRRALARRHRARARAALGSGRAPRPRERHDLGAQRASATVRFLATAMRRSRMTGENIVCFAKDWDGHPTSNTHVMRLLARRQSRPLARVDRACARPRPGAAATCAACAPPRGGGARRAPGRGQPVGREPARAAVAALPGRDGAEPRAAPRHRRRGGRAASSAWSASRCGRSCPTAGEHARDLGGRPLVYYCVDDWAHCGRPRRPARRGGRGAAVPRAPTWCSRPRASLAAAKRRWNPRTHPAPHGVDHAHFARALDPATAVAPEVAALPAAGARRWSACSTGGSTRRSSARVADRRPRLEPRAGRPRPRRPAARSPRVPTSTCSAGAHTRACPRV